MHFFNEQIPKMIIEVVLAGQWLLKKKAAI